MALFLSLEKNSFAGNQQLATAIHFGGGFFPKQISIYIKLTVEVQVNLDDLQQIL